MKSVSKDIIMSKFIALSPLITEGTRGLRFTANTVSKAMDTAGGGVLKFGGYHRVHSGHSIIDVSMWQKFGLKFPKEVAIDSLTTNGVPIPGVETLVNNGFISKSLATNWFSLNIGEIACASFSTIDTGINLFKKKKNKLNTSTKSYLFKSTVKIGVGVATTNPIPIICGAIDLGLYASQKLDRRFDFNFSPITYA